MMFLTTLVVSVSMLCLSHRPLVLPLLTRLKLSIKMSLVRWRKLGLTLYVLLSPMTLIKTVKVRFPQASVQPAPI